MPRWVEITFDCLPLRSVGRLDIPLDASPKFRERCERIKAAMERHGSHNTYYVYNARCIYHLINREDTGYLDFGFEGVMLTDANDQRSERCDLMVWLNSETCDWVSQPIIDWFEQSVRRAALAEFNDYIQAGDLDQTKQRIEKIQQASDQAGGFLGMHL